MERKTTKRNKMTVALSVCLIAVLAIGATLAFMSTTTNSLTNKFSVYALGDEDESELDNGDGPDDNDKGNAGMSGLLAEVSKNTDGTDIGGTGKTLDRDTASTTSPAPYTTLTPGQSRIKAPFIQNTTQTVAQNPDASEIDIWAAIKVAFVQGVDGKGVSNDPADYSFDPLTMDSSVPSTVDNNLAHLEALLTIDYNTTAWTREAAADSSASDTPGAYTYIHNTVVPAGAFSGTSDTAYLFRSVTLKSTVTNDELIWIRDVLEGFDIVLEGAIATDDTDLGTAAESTAKTALRNHLVK